MVQTEGEEREERQKSELATWGWILTRNPMKVGHFPSI